VIRWLWLSAVVLLLDQVSKYLAETYLRLGVPRPVIAGFFDLRLAYNPGAAFSFLGSAGGWQRWFFIGLAIAISAWLVVWLYRLHKDERVTAFGLALLLGGAVGNVWDRIMPSRAMVVDFLDFYINGMHWPAFNVADIAICCGAGALIWAMFTEPNANAEQPKKR
jgi:signal peptidase II